jgi:hypothetical protein
VCYKNKYMSCPFSAAAAAPHDMINKMYDRKDEGK